MHEQRRRLLRGARDLFFELGFSRVSMDEIANTLGMSKRTIYQLIPSKRELLRQALLDKVEEISCGLETIVETDGPDFLQKLQQVGLFMISHLPQPSRHFLRDMEQSCSSIWEEVDTARARVVQERFSSLFRQGKEQNILRRDIDSTLLVKALVGMIQSTIQPDILAHLPLSIGQAFTSLFKLLCLGLLTERGRSVYLANNSISREDSC